MLQMPFQRHEVVGAVSEMRTFHLEARASPTQGGSSCADWCLSLHGLLWERSKKVNFARRTAELHQVAGPLRSQRDPDLPVVFLVGAAAYVQW